MQILHVQVFAGIMAAGLVLAGFGAATLHAGKREVDRKLANAEKEIVAAKVGGAGTSAGAASGASAPATKGSVGALPQELERQNRDLTKRLRTLEELAAALEKENAILRLALERAQGAPAAPVAVSASTSPNPEALLPAARMDGNPRAGKASSSALARPPEIAAPAAPQGGVGEQSDIGEMAKAMKLVPEQRDELRKMWKEYQDEFDRLLTEANNAGTRDMAVLDRISAQARHNFDQRFDQMLYPEQKPLFLEWRKTRDAAEAPK
jgi:hypothetical protein